MTLAFRMAIAARRDRLVGNDAADMMAAVEPLPHILNSGAPLRTTWDYDEASAQSAVEVNGMRAEVRR